MRRVIALTLVMVVLGWPGPARAVIGTVDQVPAATLLVPFFEVDLDDPTGMTTIVSITDTAATAVLTHWTLWTDWGIPDLTFDVYPEESIADWHRRTGMWVD